MFNIKKYWRLLKELIQKNDLINTKKMSVELLFELNKITPEELKKIKQYY